MADTEEIKVGDKVDVSLFKAGDLVDVTGISKGKGFAGVVKRHTLPAGPRPTASPTGTAPRAPSARPPSRAGCSRGCGWRAHGDERVTVRNWRYVKADPERNLLLVKGAVPGAKNGLLLIKKSGGEEISSASSSL